MVRLTVLFGAALLLLGACDEQALPDKPYAPGVAKGGREVDPLVVAQRLMTAGEYELAIDAYSRAAVKNGMTVDILAGIGSASLGLGRLNTAERLLREAIEIDERSPEIWNNLGVVLIEKGNTAEAEIVFRRAYALDNGESDAIRDNLRLALAKSENTGYAAAEEQDFKLVRRGGGDYVLQPEP